MTAAPGSSLSDGPQREAWQRTHTCGVLRPANIGESVVLNGWVAGRRNLGGIFFIDLRDRYGVTQFTLTEEQSEQIKFSTEWVLSVRGTVCERESKNTCLLYTSPSPRDS